VFANPVSSHAHAALAVALVWLGSRFSTVLPLVLIGALLVLFAVGVQDSPRRLEEGEGA
jgi:hypothetical protein